jgi:hypothetical protein
METVCFVFIWSICGIMGYIQFNLKRAFIMTLPTDKLTPEVQLTTHIRLLNQLTATVVDADERKGSSVKADFLKILDSCNINDPNDPTYCSNVKDTLNKLTSLAKEKTGTTKQKSSIPFWGASLRQSIKTTLSHAARPKSCNAFLDILAQLEDTDESRTSIDLELAMLSPDISIRNPMPQQSNAGAGAGAGGADAHEDETNRPPH